MFPASHPPAESALSHPVAASVPVAAPVAVPAAAPSAVPAPAVDPDADARLTALLTFAISAVQQSMLLPESRLRRWINSIFAKSKPAGEDVGGGLKIKSIGLGGDEPGEGGALHFGPSSVSGPHVATVAGSSTLRASVRELVLRVSVVHLRVAFEQVLVGEVIKSFTVRDVEVRAGVAVTVDAAAMPTLKISPVLQPDSVHIRIGAVELDGGFMAHLVQHALDASKFDYKGLLTRALEAGMKDPIDTVEFDLLPKVK